jgi:outer membrane protein assembly factor BamB
MWEQRLNNFLSDTVYERYSIGSPVIDRETGNVYVLTTAGEFVAFTGDGERLWEHSMMEDYVRLTFPNCRVGAPVIDEDLIIVRWITSNWGLQGEAADCFYAFDKKTGEIVWPRHREPFPQGQLLFDAGLRMGKRTDGAFSIAISNIIEL